MSSHDSSAPATGGRYELRFHSLFDAGRALTFPCDAKGRVDESALNERTRANYERARKLIGRDWATPIVTPCA